MQLGRLKTFDENLDLRGFSGPLAAFEGNKTSARRVGFGRGVSH
jgi:hypothetical protein